MSDRSPPLKTGTTAALFRQEGNLPNSKLKLNKYANTSTIKGNIFFKRKLSILSIPDDKVLFKLTDSFYNSWIVTGVIKKTFVQVQLEIYFENRQYLMNYLHYYLNKQAIAKIIVKHWSYDFRFSQVRNVPLNIFNWPVCSLVTSNIIHNITLSVLPEHFWNINR